jgi:hypothetical protein
MIKTKDFRLYWWIDVIGRLLLRRICAMIWDTRGGEHHGQCSGRERLGAAPIQNDRSRRVRACGSLD